MKFELTPEKKQELEKLARENNLSLVLLFGSQATGKTHSQSDVDFAFRSEEKMSPMDEARLQLEFSKALKFKNVEIVNLRNAGPVLLRQIVQKSSLIFEKEPAGYARFKIYAHKLFMESKKLLEMRNLSLDKFLQKA